MGIDAYGGCGIYAGTISIYADCTIAGGDAYCGAPGIWCRTKCSFGTVNALIMTGEGDYGLPAVYRSANAQITTNVHTTVMKQQFYWMILINNYELRLLGKGGTIDGTATFTSLKAYYPARHDLSDYVFEKEGYTQVAWRTTSGDLLTLDTQYQPKENTLLYAERFAAEEGDVVLHSMEGTFADGERWKRYQTDSVILPKALTYKNDTLMGWSSEILPNVDYDTYMNSGIWYAPGETFTAEAETVTNLYAREQDFGQYAVYHANGGEIKAGGTMMVQGAIVTYTDLQVITPDEAYVTAPLGYKLAGWADAEDATEVQYAPGDTLYLQVATVKQLYALWEKIDADQGVEIKVESEKVQVTIPAEWCDTCGIQQGIAALYDADTGKMLAVSTTKYTAGEDLRMEVSYTGNDLPVCKVFLLDESQNPLGKGEARNLSNDK